MTPQYRNRWTAPVMLLLGLAVLGPFAAWAQDRVDKVSGGAFEQTAKQLETAIKKRGMMIVATIDHQNMLRMVGAATRGSKTLEFGKPDMMKNILPENLDVGLEMPLKIYIYERADEKAVVSYYKPSVGFARYGRQQLAMAGQMMDMMLEEIATEATK